MSLSVEQRTVLKEMAEGHRLVIGPWEWILEGTAPYYIVSSDTKLDLEYMGLIEQFSSNGPEYQISMLGRGELEDCLREIEFWIVELKTSAEVFAQAMVDENVSSLLEISRQVHVALENISEGEPSIEPFDTAVQTHLVELRK